jgi:flagellar export protein FliJ
MKEEESKREFARAQAEVKRQEQLILALTVEQARHLVEQGTVRQGSVDLLRLRLHEAYTQTLRRWISAGQTELVRRAGVLEERRQQMAEARKGVRVVEKLKERRHQAWAGEVEREERRDLDEVAQRQRQEGV